MLLPTISARIEERKGVPRLRINCFEVIAFVEVTTATAQRQVRFVIASAMPRRDDMLYLERKIENSLWGLAIFTTVRGSLRDRGVMGVHFSRSASAAAARSPEAWTSASTKAFNSACSEDESDCPVSRAVRQRHINCSRRSCC